MIFLGQGNFIKCGNDIGIYLREFFKDFKCPIIINQAIGHGEPNLAIPSEKNVL